MTMHLPAEAEIGGKLVAGQDNHQGEALVPENHTVLQFLRQADPLGQESIFQSHLGQAVLSSHLQESSSRLPVLDMAVFPMGVTVLGAGGSLWDAACVDA